MKTAGMFFVVSGVLGVLSIIVAEALYPDYSISQNFVSDLGVGPSALIFNSTIFLTGVFGIASTCLIYQAFKFKILSVTLALTQIGIIGATVFTEDFVVAHSISSLILILFGGISALLSYKLVKPPLYYVSVVLGVLTLSTLVLLVSNVDLGLGIGAIERLSLYPITLGTIGLGAYLTK